MAKALKEIELLMKLDTQYPLDEITFHYDPRNKHKTKATRRPYDLLYVVNRYRNLTATDAEAVALLGGIEGASHLKATGVVNNSHLQSETTVATVLDSLEYARETARQLGLPLVCTTVPLRLAGEFSEAAGNAAHVENAYPVQTYVRPPWEDEARV